MIIYAETRNQEINQNEASQGARCTLVATQFPAKAMKPKCCIVFDYELLHGSF